MLIKLMSLVLVAGCSVHQPSVEYSLYSVPVESTFQPPSFDILFPQTESEPRTRNIALIPADMTEAEYSYIFTELLEYNPSQNPLHVVYYANIGPSHPDVFARVLLREDQKVDLVANLEARVESTQDRFDSFGYDVEVSYNTVDFSAVSHLEHEEFLEALAGQDIEAMVYTFGHGRTQEFGFITGIGESSRHSYSVDWNDYLNMTNHIDCSCGSTHLSDAFSKPYSTSSSNLDGLVRYFTELGAYMQAGPQIKERIQETINLD